MAKADKREAEILKKVAKMIDERLKPYQSLAALKEAILTPEEDKVQRKWDAEMKRRERRKNG